MKKMVRQATAAAVCFFACALAQAQSAPPTTTTGYGYDQAGFKTSQVDALGRTTTWAVDLSGRHIGRTLPDATRESSRFDLAGRLVTKTTFAGETLSFQYDLNDYLTGQVIPAGAAGNSGVAAGSIHASYTPLGLLTSRQEQGPTTLNGTLTARYDVNSRLVEARNPIGTLSYAFDPLGQVLERSIAGAGTQRYDYDEAGRLLTLTAADGKQVRHGYDGAGRLIKIERDLNPRDGQAHFLRTSINYDSAGRPVLIAQVRHLGSTVSFVAGQQLTRGAGGAISRIETVRGDGSSSPVGGQINARIDVVQAFEYDHLARLTRETRSHTGGATDTRYAYDAVGNRTRKAVTTAAGTEITTYTYDIADRLSEETTSLPAGGSLTVAYTYDGNGNLASKNEVGRVTLYRFDPRNRLIDIRVGNTLALAQQAAPSVRYAYDADGNRVRKWAGQETGYLVDANDLLPQVALERAGTASVQYVRGAGMLLRQIKVSDTGTEDLYPLYGHLGTSLGAVNADGVLVEQTDSDAFGNAQQAAHPKLTHLYAGEYWDQDAQLLYLRARWYDPRTGRFISADPFEGRQSDPRSLNRYVYAHGDPVHNSDPGGMFAITDATAGTLTVNLAQATTATSTSLIGAGLVARVGLAMISGVVGTYALVSHAEKLKLQDCIDSAKRGENKCKPDYSMVIVGDDFNEVRDHIGNAISGGRPSMLSRRQPAHPRGWIEKFKGPAKPCSGGPGTECDEYPFAASMEGGSQGNSSLCSVNGPQNGGAGIQMRWFYEKCKVPKNDPGAKYKVIAARGIETGYVCSR